MEDLDRDLPLQGSIQPPIHHAHPAGAHLLENAVTPNMLSHERHAPSVSETGAHALGKADQLSVGIHPPVLRNASQWHSHNLVSMERHHVIPLPVAHQIQNLASITHGEEPIGRGWASAALEMT